MLTNIFRARFTLGGKWSCSFRNNRVGYATKTIIGGRIMKTKIPIETAARVMCFGCPICTVWSM